MIATHEYELNLRFSLVSSGDNIRLESIAKWAHPTINLYLSSSEQHMKERMRECGIEPPNVSDDIELSSNLHQVIITDVSGSSNSLSGATAATNSSTTGATLTTLTPVSSNHGNNFILNSGHNSGLAMANSAPPPALLQMVDPEAHDFLSYNEPATFLVSGLVLDE